MDVTDVSSVAIYPAIVTEGVGDSPNEHSLDPQIPGSRLPIRETFAIPRV